MVAQAPDRRPGRLAGAAGVALLLAGLTLLAEPASWRGPAVALLAVGIVAGALAAMRLPAPGRFPSPMERLNDAAFLVVVSAVALIVVRLARPWTAALPGLVGGFLIGWSLRPRPTQPEAPQARSATPPGEAETPPDQAEEPGTSPGQAGTPRPGAGPPESGG
jgi:hypothetical protein